VSFLCREHLCDGECLREATFICGSRVHEADGRLAARWWMAGYPACDRCAHFWAEESRHEVTGDEPHLAEFVAAWEAVPTLPPSRLVRLTPAHRAAEALEHAEPRS
jgi:hypothetical protein